MLSTDVVSVEHLGDIAVLTVDSPPVNTLSNRVRCAIVRAVDELAGDESVRALVLICAGRTFFAGAELTEIGAAPTPPTFADTIRSLENCPRVVVAAIHGSALGGGLELALGCDYRVATDSAVCGLPEVTLGLMPGAGGTQRLPRLIGVPAAVDLITSGRRVPAEEAVALGLIDHRVPDDALRAEAVRIAGGLVDESAPKRLIRELPAVRWRAGDDLPDFAALRAGIARRHRGVIAPGYCLRAIEAAVTSDFDAGLEFERTLFDELLQSDQSQALRYAFFAERRVTAVPGVQPAAAMEVDRVGVIGSGTMGRGIAMAFANAGIAVRLVDVTPEALQRGAAAVSAQYGRSVGRGSITEAESRARLARITTSTELASVSDCDLVVEAIFERLDLKVDLFRTLDSILPARVILASNTSALSVDDLAAATSRPDRVVGLHFFSPANVMKLVEIVRGAQTSPPVTATAMSLARRLGKLGVVVGVCPGFVGNRMAFVRSAAADQLLLAGAMPWDVDRAMVDFGFPMGPFHMSDLAGLDVRWNREASRAASIREVLCEAGRFGQKSGAGFYDYPSGRDAVPSAFTRSVVERFAERSGADRSGGDRSGGSTSEICRRLLFPMINEGAKILEEGIALRAGDIDVIWLAGYGFPRHRGGPMYYADTVGLGSVVQELRTQQNSDLEISPLLQRLAVEGGTFQSLTVAEEIEPRSAWGSHHFRPGS